MTGKFCWQALNMKGKMQGVGGAACPPTNKIIIKYHQKIEKPQPSTKIIPRAHSKIIFLLQWMR